MKFRIGRGAVLAGDLEQLAETLTAIADGKEIGEIPPWFLEWIVTIHPVGWTRLGMPGFPFMWERTAEPRNSRMRVIVTGRIEADGKKWVHVSFSRPSRVPDYKDVCTVKEHFIGEDRKAIQVHPPKSEHFNAVATVLHLWHPVDHDPLPDFRVDGRSI